MAATYSYLKMHIVFATKNRVPLIDHRWRGDLHAYLGGTLRGLGGHPLVVGGTDDHIHLVAGLKPTHAPADIVRELKKSSSAWASDRRAGFAWQAGYGAFSIGPSQEAGVLDYVMRQEEHHLTVSSADELRSLLNECGIEFDERYFE